MWRSLKIKKNSLEKEFENILVRYPYLIDESFSGGKVENQYRITLSNGNIRYIDIIYFTPNKITIIELKKDMVIKKDIQQLSEYVNHIKILYPNKKIQAILAGQRLEKNLELSLNLRGFIFKKYFKDIPFEIKLCSKCRKATGRNQNRCSWCSYQEFIKL